jgi:hypothetical protein
LGGDALAHPLPFDRVRFQQRAEVLVEDDILAVPVEDGGGELGRFLDAVAARVLVRRRCAVGDTAAPNSRNRTLTDRA